MDIILDDAQDPAIDRDTAMVEGALQKYFRIFQCPFQELLDHLKQGCSNVEMRIDLLLADSPYNVRRELGRKTSDHDLFSEDDIAGKVKICGGCLKLGSHAHRFCFAVQFPGSRLFSPLLRASP